MKRIDKKNFTDIGVFYPDSINDEPIDYVENIDYNSEIFESPFTRELSRSLVTYILDQFENTDTKVLAWKIEISYFPLIIELLSRENVGLLFAYTKSADCVRMLSNVLTLLNLGNKCCIVKSNKVNLPELTGIIYIGVDQLPFEFPDKKPDNSLPLIGGLVLIKTTSNISLNLTSNKKLQFSQKTFKNINISIQINDKAEYLTEEEIEEYTTIEDEKYVREEPKKTLPKEEVRGRTQVTTLPKQPRGKSEQPRGRSERSEQPTGRSAQFEQPSKFAQFEQPKGKFAQIAQPKEKVWFTETLAAKKEETSKKKEEPSEKVGKIPEKGEKIPEKEEGASQMMVKGDKYPEIKKLNLKNANEGHPEVGGWIQIDNGVQNFYVFGVEILSSPTSGVNRNSKQYKQELANYIVQLIGLFNPFEDLDLESLVSTNYIDLWLQTWTHESYDIDSNYETLETVGDAGFGYCFLSFLYRTFPDVTHAELTALKANIGSKKSLRQVGWGLKMDQWLRMGSQTRSNTNTSEDIVEAFCATLQIVTNDIFSKMGSQIEELNLDIGPGTGIIMINAFINFLFSTVNFTEEMFRGDSKTTLLQSVQGIAKNGPELIEDYEETMTYKHRMKLLWSDSALSYFNSNGYPMRKEIANAEAQSKRAVSDKVYTLAIQNLKKEGYTIKWFRNIKNQIQMAQFDPTTVEDVMKKVKSEYGNKTTIKFYIPKSLNTISSVTIELQAIIPDSSRTGKMVRLATVTNEHGDTNEAKKEVLEKYLGSKK